MLNAETMLEISGRSDSKIFTTKRHRIGFAKAGTGFFADFASAATDSSSSSLLGLPSFFLPDVAIAGIAVSSSMDFCAMSSCLIA